MPMCPEVEGADAADAVPVSDTVESKPSIPAPIDVEPSAESPSESEAVKPEEVGEATESEAITILMQLMVSEVMK